MQEVSYEFEFWVLYPYHWGRRGAGGVPCTKEVLQAVLHKSGQSSEEAGWISSMHQHPLTASSRPQSLMEPRSLQTDWSKSVIRLKFNQTPISSVMQEEKFPYLKGFLVIVGTATPEPADWGAFCAWFKDALSVLLLVDAVTWPRLRKARKKKQNKTGRPDFYLGTATVASVATSDGDFFFFFFKRRLFQLPNGSFRFFGA